MVFSRAIKRFWDDWSRLQDEYRETVKSACWRFFESQQGVARCFLACPFCFWENVIDGLCEAA